MRTLFDDAESGYLSMMYLEEYITWLRSHGYESMYFLNFES
jgi:hypothetical protein